MKLDFTIIVEIYLYHKGYEDCYDIDYEYASNLNELLALTNPEFLEKRRVQYDAQKVTVGKIELVSLQDETEEVRCMDGRVVINIDDKTISGIFKK